MPRDTDAGSVGGPTERPRWRLSAAAAALIGIAALHGSRADAQPRPGTWVAGSTRVQVTVESWGPDCPRRPTSTTRPGEGRVPLRLRGDHVELGGAVGLSSDTCWSANRALRRVSTTHRGDSWVTRCRTPSADSRVESGTYTLRLTGPDRLEREGVSSYDWTLNESRCVATVVERQTFTRPPDAPPAATDDDAEPPAAVADCIPGPPRRIRLRPEARAVEPGERACFRATVVDAEGCPIPSARVDLRLRRPPGVTGQLRGRCFEAGDTAATAEGTFQVLARSGDLEASATLVVRTSDLSDLRAKRIAHGAGAATGGDLEAGDASRLAARAGQGAGRALPFWVALAAGLALLALAAASAVLVARRRAAASIAPPPGSGRPARGPTTPAPPPAMTDPPPGLSGGPGPAPAAPRERGDARICPVCRRGFPESARFCPHDSATLVEYGEWAQTAGRDVAPALRCPRCGRTYPEGNLFCGEDGETLVPLK